MGFDMYIIKAKKTVLNDICEKYVYLDKKHYDLMLSFCNARMEYLKRYIYERRKGVKYGSITFYAHICSGSGKRTEYMECERLFYWLQKLNPNWDEDVMP